MPAERRPAPPKESDYEEQWEDLMDLQEKEELLLHLGYSKKISPRYARTAWKSLPEKARDELRSALRDGMMIYDWEQSILREVKGRMGEAAKRGREEDPKGVTLGYIDSFEPWLREELSEPGLTSKHMGDVTREARTRLSEALQRGTLEDPEGVTLAYLEAADEWLVRQLGGLREMMAEYEAVVVAT